MTTSSSTFVTSEHLISGLQQSEAYPHAVAGGIQMRQTHISWVFLAGDFAYKVKKPIKSSFLDYSTLQRRQHFCQEELRLDRRYAPQLYLGVVPITLADQQICLDGPGEPVEFAVKMHRFPDDALLSTRLSNDIFNAEELGRLTNSIASFHLQADRVGASNPWGSPEYVYQDALDNFCDLRAFDLAEETATLHVLENWTNEFYTEHQPLLAQRVANGFIRECHGDLHLANVIDWQGQIMPFDGIEFSDRFRWIDVLSDAAFLAMDFAARGHLELCRSFINSYLEQTGDHASLPLLRWYLVFRSLVRAKVDAMNLAQVAVDHTADPAAVLRECQRHIQLAYRFTVPEQPCLYITHGLSGSGKTTGSEAIIRQQGAIRLRSDFERKRHFGIEPSTHPTACQREKIYSDAATSATYCRLRRLSHMILQARYSVVVDATFLKRCQRDSFRALADSMGVDFRILDFGADLETLRRRISDRIAAGDDASDADHSVLEQQIKTHETLTDSERAVAICPPLNA